VDEAHFFPVKSIHNGPLAMLLQNARLIFASTPEVGESPCRHILDGRVNGEPICEYVNFEFICPRCKEAMQDDDSVMCPHRFFWLPQFQNPDVMFIAREAFGQSSDGFRREIMGTQAVSAQTFIQPNYIQALRERPPYVFRQAPRVVYVSADPSGASRHYEDGNTSDYAIVTSCCIDGMTVVSSFFSFFYCSYLYPICVRLVDDGGGAGPPLVSKRRPVEELPGSRVIKRTSTLGVFGSVAPQCSRPSHGIISVHFIRPIAAKTGTLSLPLKSASVSAGSGASAPLTKARSFSGLTRKRPCVCESGGGQKRLRKVDDIRRPISSRARW
jgi:hypothetical protein